MEPIKIGELKWYAANKKLKLPVDISFYPEGMDELLCAAKSRDESRGGWVTCRAIGATGDGVETIRDATHIEFNVPMSYYIQAQGEDDPEFSFCFRKSNERTPPAYFYVTRKMPAQDWGRKASTSIPEPLRSFLTYALEEQHGWAHQLKWARVLLAAGYAWEGYSGKMMEQIFRAAEREGPMDYQECLGFYERHGRNKRWTLAKKWFEESGDVSREKLEEQFKADRARAEEIRKYKNAPPTQGNYSAEQWKKRYGVDPEVAMVLGWGKYIIDPQTREPLWGLDGDFPAHHCWKYEDGKWIDMDAKPKHEAKSTELVEEVLSLDKSEKEKLLEVLRKDLGL